MQSTVPVCVYASMCVCQYVCMPVCVYASMCVCQCPVYHLIPGRCVVIAQCVVQGVCILQIIQSACRHAGQTAGAYTSVQTNSLQDSGAEKGRRGRLLMGGLILRTLRYWCDWRHVPASRKLISYMCSLSNAHDMTDPTKVVIQTDVTWKMCFLCCKKACSAQRRVTMRWKQTSHHSLL